MSPQKLSPKANLRKLQKEWYNRLKKEGFNDIEHYKNGTMEPKILSPAHAVRMGYTTEMHEDYFEYYRSAGLFLHEYKFTSWLDHKIWDMHANGAYLVDIKLNDDVRYIVGQMKGPYIVSKALKRLKKEFKEWLYETNKNGASR